MNEFERQREARIARNKSILERLIASNPAHAALHAERPTPAKPRGPRPKQPTNEADLRRSGRVRRLPAPVYTTFDVNDDLGDGVSARCADNVNFWGGASPGRPDIEVDPQAESFFSPLKHNNRVSFGRIPPR